MAETQCPSSAIETQMQGFLDEWYYRILSCPIGKCWSREKAASLLLDVFDMIGFKFTPDERDAAIKCEEDVQFVAIVVGKMPDNVRNQFDQVSLQIQTVLHEASRIRTAAEDGEEAVAELFDEAGSEKGGLTQQVLKASVVKAAKEVSKLRRIHTTWKKNTDNRIQRLLIACEDAAHANQQLLAVESQLSQYQDDQKAKSKSFLMNMADGQDSALLHSAFSSWLGYAEKVQAEKGIRKKISGPDRESRVQAHSVQGSAARQCERRCGAHAHGRSRSVDAHGVEILA